MIVQSLVSGLLMVITHLTALSSGNDGAHKALRGCSWWQQLSKLHTSTFSGSTLTPKCSSRDIPSSSGALLACHASLMVSINARNRRLALTVLLASNT